MTRRCAHCGRVIANVWTANGIEADALDQIEHDLFGAPEDCRRFFNALFCTTITYPTTAQLTRDLGVCAETLFSRFTRHRLPTPKAYLTFARLTRIARILEDPTVSLAQASLMMGFSCKDVFYRTTMNVLGVGGMQFRAEYSGERMLLGFRDMLVLPFVDRLREFHPLVEQPKAYAALRRRA